MLALVQPNRHIVQNRRDPRHSSAVHKTDLPSRDAESKESRAPGALSNLTEVLAQVFARAGELEALLAADLPGARMREVIQIERARMEFQRFVKMLGSELSTLHPALGNALAVATGARERGNGDDPFQFPAKTTAAALRRRR